MRPRIGTEAHLVLAPRAGVFLERAVIGGADPIPPCPDELLDLMRAGFAIQPMYTLRYFSAQVADFNYDEEEPESEHITAAYVCRFQVAMRKELLRCVALDVSAEPDAYERVPIILAAVVHLMMMSVDDRQLPTQTGLVTIHGVGSWLRRARDVPNYQRLS